MKSERLQVLIDPEQRVRLEQTAVARGVSVASLVRSAIDVVYPSHARQRAAAASEVLAAAPMDVPPVADLLDELDEVRGRRA